MDSISAGQEWTMDVAASDVVLLADALQDAVDAMREGRIIGPGIDEVALRRAQRRALRKDLARQLRTVDLDGVA